MRVIFRLQKVGQSSVQINRDHTNDISNGLLLRADIHTLFDCGELGIDTENMKVVMSSRLAGSSYKYLAGKPIRLPHSEADHPSISALDKHRDEAGL
jgi:predicted restriction endonuclease